MYVPRMFAAGFLAGGLAMMASGCSDRLSGRASAPSAPPPDNLPPNVDAAQLAYDPNLRTVHFYDLIADPKTGRKATWEVRFPDGTTAFPAGRTLQLREEVDEADVVIKASDPPGPSSPGVKLSDVPRRK